MTTILHGFLDYFSLPMVLQFLSMNEKTGGLGLISQEKETQIFFSHGSVVFAVSNQEKFRLGAILVRKRKMDTSQQKKIEQRMLSGGGKFGSIAVQDGILSREELHTYLKIQASEIIYDSFAWSGGAFSFVNQSHPPDYAVPIAIDLTNLIMEGARRMDEFGYFNERLPEKSAIYQVSPNPDIQEKISLSLTEWKILFLINGKRTLEDICSESSEEELEVYKIVYGLYVNKLVEVVNVKERSPSETYTLQPEEAANAVAGIPVAKPVQQQKDVRLLISPEARLTWSDVLKDTLAQVQWSRGGGDLVTFPLTSQEYSIGRAKENSICLDEASVSGIHARIVRGSDGYVLEDLKSTNGSHVNDVPISRQPLRHNDRIRLGNAELLYTVLLKGSR